MASEALLRDVVGGAEWEAQPTPACLHPDNELLCMFTQCAQVVLIMIVITIAI